MEQLKALWVKNLQAAHGRSGLTAAELAERVEVDRQSIYLWLSGQRTPKDEHKIRLARALRTDVAVLFPLIDFEQAAAQ